MTYFDPNRFGEFEIQQERFLLERAYNDLVGEFEGARRHEGLDPHQSATIHRYGAEGYAGLGEYDQAMESIHNALLLDVAELHLGINADRLRHHAKSLICLGMIGLCMAMDNESVDTHRALTAVHDGAHDYDEHRRIMGGSYHHDEVRDRRRVALVESVLGSSWDGLVAARTAVKIADLSSRRLIIVPELPEWPVEPSEVMQRKAMETRDVAWLALVSPNRRRNSRIVRHALNAL